MNNTKRELKKTIVEYKKDWLLKNEFRRTPRGYEKKCKNEMLCFTFNEIEELPFVEIYKKCKKI